MHILTIPEGISEPIPVAGGQPLEAGKEYICTNAFAGALMLTPWRVVIDEEAWSLRSLIKVDHFVEQEFNPKLDWNGAHIWLMRAGGWGDLLMLTPTIRELKKRWPRCIVHVAMGESHKGLFNGLGVIEESIPMDYDKLLAGPNESVTILVAFEDWIEGHPGAEKVHIAQHFANKLGLDLDGNHKPDFIISEEEELWREATFPRTAKKRVGLQYMASALYRTYPHTEKVIKLLMDHDIEVFLFGTKGQLTMKGDLPPGLTNLTDPSFDATFRRSAALAKSCDCIISPDSAMVHVAAALEVPYIGLYGPIPPQLRGSGKNGKGLFGEAPCSPCFFHAERSDQFPAGMPCTDKGYCVALAAIPPEQVVEEALKLVSPIIQLPKQNSGRIIVP